MPSSEKLVEMLKIRLDSLMQEYIGGITTNPDIWIRLQGKVFDNGRAPLGLVGSFIKKLVTANQHAVALLEQVKYEGQRINKKIKDLAELDLVAIAPGSLKLGIKKPLIPKFYKYQVDNQEQILDEKYILDCFEEATRESEKAIEGLQLLSRAIIATNDEDEFKALSALTSGEIISIRGKYGVSQKDFSEVLDWGMATITRYENHQVQTHSHDNVLRKIDSDPKWFLEMLNGAKGRISYKAFRKYYHEAREQFKKKRNQYLIDSIQAIYAGIEDEILTGKTKLNLNKVVEMINYLASKVSSLHKVKLMKMLWYSDCLHYKRYGTAISGLAYSALPMGAVPEGYEQIVILDGVTFDTISYGEYIEYKFKSTPGFEIKELTQPEIQTLDYIISKLWDLPKYEIVDKMYNEEAYRSTASFCIIPYYIAELLAID